ncbi:MAG: hypothetical protein AB1505_33920 [Candidatus Latescibacterota bacterium]
MPWTRNATDDFLACFSDRLRSAASEPPPSGRVTEHFVAVPGSLLDVEVDLGGARADPGAGLRVDLSALGLEPVLLDRDGRGGYTGTLRLPDGVRNGVYALPVTRVDGAGGAEHAYGIRVTVLPSSDLVVLDEDVGPGWSIGSTGGVEEVVTAAGEVVFTGRTAARIRGQKSVAAWSVPFVAADSLSAFGYSSLRLAFAPGTAVLAAEERFSASIGKHLTSLRDRVDLARPEWQVVEVPLETLPVEKEVAGSPGFRFAGFRCTPENTL